MADCSTYYLTSHKLTYLLPDRYHKLIYQLPDLYHKLTYLLLDLYCRLTCLPLDLYHRLTYLVSDLYHRLIKFKIYLSIEKNCDEIIITFVDVKEVKQRVQQQVMQPTLTCQVWIRYIVGLGFGPLLTTSQI